MFPFVRPKEAALAAPPRPFLELDNDDECLDALLHLLGKLALRRKRLERPARGHATLPPGRSNLRS